LVQSVVLDWDYSKVLAMRRTQPLAFRFSFQMNALLRSRNTAGVGLWLWSGWNADDWNVISALPL